MTRQTGSSVIVHMKAEPIGTLANRQAVSTTIIHRRTCCRLLNDRSRNFSASDFNGVVKSIEGSNAICTRDRSRHQSSGAKSL
jgi:hypothetical protein